MLTTLPLLLALLVPAPVASSDRVDEYLMDTSLEIALARSAAPTHITEFATVLVLTRDGYEVVHEGSNGFTCLVLRSFSGPGRAFDPRSRAPICYTPGAEDSALAVALAITDGVVAGMEMPEILEQIDRDLEAGRIARSEPGDLAYMMSGEQWLNERVGRWLPHLMFYMPDVSHAELGGNRFGSNLPIVVGGDTGDYGDVTVALDEEDFLPVHRFDRALLEHPSRPAVDRAQDEGRRALDVYEWLGIRPGMTVADVIAAGGYNTQLLSLALASDPASRVHAVISELAGPIQEAIGLDSKAAVAERIEAGSLTNVIPTPLLGDLPEAGVDVIVSIRNLHDFDYFGSGSDRAAQAMFRALRPGGILGVVEVATDRPGWDEETHRLNEDRAVEILRAAGFELVGRSHLLRNPDDDYSAAGFDTGRHLSDRYLLKFRRPVR